MRAMQMRRLVGQGSWIALALKGDKQAATNAAEHASILLSDGVFDQTVVLVLDADEDGSLGVILNQISQTPLDAVLPDWFTQGLGVTFIFGGTSLLIVVGVAMDTVQQIESQLIMRHYDGFMKKTRIRGRRG